MLKHRHEHKDNILPKSNIFSLHHLSVFTCTSSLSAQRRYRLSVSCSIVPPVTASGFSFENRTKKYAVSYRFSI